MNGIEFVTLRVKGQSFILHQIRKMVGMTLAVMRGAATTDHLKRSLRKDTVMPIPMAPEVGLFLKKCVFEFYNKRFSATHEPLDSDNFIDVQTKFKEDFLYPHIANKEKHERTMELFCRNNMDQKRFDLPVSN